MNKREKGDKSKERELSKEKDMHSSMEAIIKDVDTKLLKDMVKLVNRTERIFVPATSIKYNPMTDRLAELMKSVQQGKYLEDVKEFNRADVYNVLSKNSEAVLRKVNWKLFEDDLYAIASDGKDDFVMPREVLEQINIEVRLHEEKLEKAGKKEKLRQLQVKFEITFHFILLIEVFCFSIATTNRYFRANGERNRLLLENTPR